MTRIAMSFALLAALATTAQAQEVTVTAVKVDEAPKLDGDAGDAAWEKAEWFDIQTSRTDLPGKGKILLKLKVVYTDTEVFFLAQWPDDSHDVAHKPYEWYERGKKYMQSEEILEDQFSLAFPLKGEFTADMYSHLEAKWDVWQWGAARTPHGYARDRIHQYAFKKPKRLPKGVEPKEYTSRDNKSLFIIRHDDRGTPAVKKLKKRPTKHTKDVVQQYVPQEPKGSAADVKAKGVWKDNQWTLELSRKLSTGSARDDTKFNPKKDLPFAAGIFNHDDETVHRTSKILRLTWK